MRTSFFVLVICLIMVSLVSAATTTPVRQYFTKEADVTFGWDYDFTVNAETAGFNLYYIPTGTTTSKTVKIEGKVKEYKFASFPAGSTICYLTAYDLYGNESDYSETIQINKKTIKPASPTTIRISNPAFTIVIPPATQ